MSTLIFVLPQNFPEAVFSMKLAYKPAGKTGALSGASELR